MLNISLFLILLIAVHLLHIKLNHPSNTMIIESHENVIREDAN